jgi:hydroxymethylpyrimidine/phosphomethylpyrimidine kinase
LSEKEQITEVVENEVESTQSGVKTFTQEEVDNLIESRLARAKKQMPNKEEIEAFKQWKESQKTEAEKLAQREQEYHQLQSEKENLKRENIVLKSGVNYDDADYVMYKISKLDGEFEDNLKSFLTENPRFLGQISTVKNTGVISKTTALSNDEDGYLSILRRKHPNVFKE